LDQPRSVTIDLGGRAGDLNNDGLVDQIDLDQLRVDFGRTDLPPSDVNRDGIVNVADLGIVLSNWTGGLTVTSAAATAVTSTSATLNGSVTPGGKAGTTWFEWSTSPTLTTFATTPLQSLPAGTTAVPISAGVSGLSANTTYYFRAAGSNSGGTAKGDIVSFNTPSPPTLTIAGAGTGGVGQVRSSPMGIDCTISPATATGSCSATFSSGTVVTLNLTLWTGSTVTGWSGIAGSCSGIVCQVTLDQARSVTVTLGGRAGDVNGDGLVDQIDLDQVRADWGRTDRPPADINRDGIVDGRDLSIVLSNWTGGLTVTTAAASAVTSTSATLNGSVTPGGKAATAWFEWGTDPTLATFATTPLQSLPAGTTAVPISAGVSGLSANTTYYFRAAASNSGGTAKSDILSFSVLGRATSDRLDDVSGTQIHVMYVLPSDGTDRALDLSGTLQNTVGAFQTWLAGQTSGRRLRLDTYNGSLDISFFRLSRSDAVMQSYGAFVRDTIEKELTQAGFASLNKVYATYYDGGSTFSCGAGPWPPALPGRVAALYLQGTPPSAPACNTNVFASSPTAPAGYFEFSMLHEILHALGFVAANAPHQWQNGHVPEPTDLMYRGDGPWQLSLLVLDVGNDDYYGPNVPTGVLNLSQSSFLLPAPLGGARNAQ